MRLGGRSDRPPIRLVVIGASFVEQGGFDHLQGLLGGRVKFSKVATGGHRTDQIGARIESEVLPLNPDIVIPDAGGNDVLQDIPTATIQANLTNLIYAPLEAAGVQCMSVGMQVMPNNYAPTDTVNNVNAPARIAARLAMEEWIEAQGRPFFSYGDAVGDGTEPNPQLPALYDGGDHLHLSAAGKLAQSITAHKQLFSGGVW
jgi:lysophospholipase L1-like esterase